MHARRQLPNRVSTRNVLLALLASVLASACISDRYVGSIGRDGTYSNRGYGFAVLLLLDGLDKRWTAIDPAFPQHAPDDLMQEIRDEPIDLDGNGELDMGETTRFLVPTLRFVSTSTPSEAEMYVDVAIIGGTAKDAPLDSLLIHELRRLARTSTSADHIVSTSTKETVSSSFDARIAEARAPEAAGGKMYRVAVVDQNEFVAEQGVKRRQLIRVVLAAPELNAQLREDHNKVLRALVLNRKAGAETTQERW
jgi:hypothetical protein